MEAYVAEKMVVYVPPYVDTQRELPHEGRHAAEPVAARRRENCVLICYIPIRHGDDPIHM